ncbi:ABC transporter permease [Enterococcus casseliflavus]|uniref:ABC transporter permease n=1 Tax=Enterococcus TaxID=1350 RepID=UPI001C469D75|nr:ABC transporter permease [Enterococcus casseliflavus]MBV6373244.1 ABC transporter permease [Enterococcus casseliflavus]
MDFFTTYGKELLFKTWEHLYISITSVILGILVAIPLGILLYKMGRKSEFFINFIGFFQTIPSIALLSLMIPIFGIGKPPAIAALFLYSLLPILRNTYVGLSTVNPDYIDAGKGMGMSSSQVLGKIELPLSMGIIMAGIRVSTIYIISWTILASYIGGGGLGDFIFNGLTLYRTDLLLMGTIPVTILALTIDYALKKIEQKLVEQAAGL